MKKGMLLVIGGVLVFAVSGCVTFSELFKAEPETGSANHLNLTQNERYYLQDWQHAAALADDAEDYATAIMYYTKLAEMFPDTSEGVRAAKRLKVLKKGCK